MTSVPSELIPVDEGRRMERLNNLCILDTPEEERFDRFTRMAIRMFNVPIAYVSLIDNDRQWFKSKIGLPLNELPRGMSMCSHTIVSGQDIVVIEDTAKIERFKDNPMVHAEPPVAFYASVPIPSSATHQGSGLGTFCIVDHVPREFSEDDRKALIDIGDMVGETLLSLDLAKYDDLTGILNRRAIEWHGNKAIEVARSASDCMSVIYFDLDKFKDINDTYGHQAGDDALRAFSYCLKKTLREDDHAGRVGGDEFMAILPGASRDEARGAVLRLRIELESWRRRANSPFAIQFSSGVVELDPITMESLDDVTAVADRAMFEDKRVG